MAHQTAMYAGVEICQCCSTIVVQGGGGPLAKQSSIFETYALEADLVNGHGHYTSLDGTMALAYNTDNNEWKLQGEDKR